jgi:hypothetical protein
MEDSNKISENATGGIMAGHLSQQDKELIESGVHPIINDQNICEKCGSEKIMHYRLYCPKCTKPEPEINITYDLLECLYYVEAHGHPGFKDKAFLFIISEWELSNESTCLIDVAEEEGKEGYLKNYLGNNGVRR